MVLRQLFPSVMADVPVARQADLRAVRHASQAAAQTNSKTPLVPSGSYEVERCPACRSFGTPGFFRFS
jgi:hypothetical protein